MKYTFQLNYKEVQEAVRDKLRPNLPHFAVGSDIEVTLEDSEGRTIKVENIVATYKYDTPEEGKK